MPDAKKKPKKESFAVRMKRRGREFKNLGQTLANEPKEFPNVLLGVIRRSFRTLWDARGGGLYACGYLVSFVWMEVKMFVDDIVEAESVGGFFSEQIFEFFFKYLGESLQNMIVAFMWPVFVVTFATPWGAIGLGLTYAAFDSLFKKPIEAWLFHDEQTPDDIKPPTSSVQEEC